MMVGRVADAPWRMPANLEDMRAFFNYDLNPHKWREYCKRVEQYRLQYTMQVHTQSGSLAARRAMPAYSSTNTVIPGPESQTCRVGVTHKH